MPLQDYPYAALHLVLRLVGGGMVVSGFAAGGGISQRINKGPLPPCAYNFEKRLLPA